MPYFCGGNMLFTAFSDRFAFSAVLPEPIVNLIAAQSFEGDRAARISEADFVRATDGFVFKCTVAGLSESE